MTNAIAEMHVKGKNP